jgi:diguanylate cyclase (GGDEF)-like protein
VSQRLVNKLVNEFHNINGSLKAVLERDEEYSPREAAFSETEEILPAIYSLSSAISHRHKLLARQAETDALTGLGNRRFYEDYLQGLWKNKPTLPCYLVYLDIDHFKQCNDTYGHEKGDEVLKGLVSCLKLHSRKEDVFIRLGGDEFVAVLTEINIETLYIWHQRISECFADMQLQAGLEDRCCTISAGAIKIDVAASSIETVNKLADKALYDSKHNGRDMITVAEVN